jgi:hypothetical protein
LERRAEGVDKDTESYDRIINGARIGAQIGIGDLLSNVSATTIMVEDDFTLLLSIEVICAVCFFYTT